MALAVQEKSGLFRIVDEVTGVIALNTANGKPLDGGGHTNNQKARRQAGYINDGIRKAAERKVVQGENQSE